MNANFERSGIFPLDVVPRYGWGKDNPTGEYVITSVNQPGQAAKIGPDHEVEWVTFDEATLFDNVVAGVRVASKVVSAATV